MSEWADLRTQQEILLRIHHERVDDVSNMRLTQICRKTKDTMMSGGKKWCHTRRRYRGRAFGDDSKCYLYIISWIWFLHHPWPEHCFEHACADFLRRKILSHESSPTLECRFEEGTTSPLWKLIREHEHLKLEDGSMVNLSHSCREPFTNHSCIAVTLKEVTSIGSGKYTHFTVTFYWSWSLTELMLNFLLQR